jgi:hypothetical protein
MRRRIRRWRAARQTDLRQRLAEDVNRARLGMVAVIVDARRIGAPVPVEVGRTMVTLTLWNQQIQAWARESES